MCGGKPWHCVGGVMKDAVLRVVGLWLRNYNLHSCVGHMNQYLITAKWSVAVATHLDTQEFVRVDKPERHWVGQAIDLEG